MKPHLGLVLSRHWIENDCPKYLHATDSNLPNLLVETPVPPEPPPTPTPVPSVVDEQESPPTTVPEGATSSSQGDVGNRSDPDIIQETESSPKHVPTSIPFGVLYILRVRLPFPLLG
jgi:hypothetical protein